MILTLIFITFLFFDTSFGQTLARLDSLAQVMKVAVGDEKSKTLIKISRQLASSNPDTCFLLLREASLVARSKEMKGKVYFEHALLHRFLGNAMAQRNFLDSAYMMLSTINDSIAGDVLHYKHMLLGNQGRYKEALQTGHKELTLRKQLASRDKELNAMLQIGYTYDRMGEYQRAIEWYNKGLRLQGVRNNDYIGRNYGLIGIAYDELKNYQKAVEYNLKAISYFKAMPHSVYLHTWYSNLGNTYLKMGKLALAEKYTLLALEDVRKKRYVTQINLAKIYLAKNELSKAETLLKDVLVGLKRADQDLYQSEAYHSLHELYKKRGDFKTALHYFTKYKQNEDERLSAEKLKQLNELTVQYQTAEKEKEILAQRSELTQKELALKNRSLWIFGLTALAIIIGLIGYLLYKQQMLKNTKQQKDNELQLALEKIANQNSLQEQRLAISRDLHDNIGAQLAFIVSAIDTVKYFVTDKDEKIGLRLNHVAVFAKQTIQELRDTVWAMNKTSISIKDLQSRIANFMEKAQQANTKVRFSVKADVSRINEKQFTGFQGLNIFRIIQEAISNAVKYAESANIQLHIVEADDCVTFYISDDGKGFDESSVELGNGLLNMRKRATALGATLTINSSIGSGTRVSICLKS